MSPLEKYLKTYATKFDFLLSEYRWDNAVVLPTFGEEIKDAEEVLSTLQLAAITANKSILAILVVNQRAIAKNEYKEKNRELLAHFGVSNSYSLQQRKQLSVLTLNRTLPEFEFGEKEGVGLARKIGCDLAALLYAKKQLSSPWIYTTDIDARVEKDYFQDETHEKDTALVLFPFRHSFNQEDGTALLYYDIWMRYYTLSLKKAGSPFAYSTLGSTFCIHTDAYAKVRGFPNRLAAEDFHLASKLSKVGAIQYSKLSPLTLIGRGSDRVPFGTGVGTSKYTRSLESKEEILFINPLCFESLELFQRRVLEHLSNPKDFPLQVEKEIDEALQLSTLIQTAVKTRTNTKDRLLHFKAAFDALKTLRFVHLNENLYPKVNFETALRMLDVKYDTKKRTLREISDLMAKDECG